jgi:1-acyl-sn-glycerol-3-phosphate acyltransferase
MIQGLRALLFYLFGFSAAFLFSLLALLLFWAPQSWLWRLVNAISRLLIWAGEFFCGMKVEFEGKENIPDEPCVIMIKHTTTLEVYAYVPLFPRTCWVLKREILWIPVIGWAIGLLFRPIAIWRSTKSTAVRQVIRQGRERLADGYLVTIFPEGTRVPPGETRRYGVSGAALAMETGVPIIPIAHNAGDFWRRREFAKRPGTVRFVIGPPISAQGRRPRETNEVVQDWIEGRMREISAHYD